MRPLVGWLALGVSLTGAVGALVYNFQSQPQVYLGNLVPEGRFVQAVGLTYRNQRQPWCTGTLIGPNLVLTAAHCVCEETPTHVFVGNDPRKGMPGRSEYYPIERVKAAAPCGEDPAGRDFALVKLDRRVADAIPLSFTADADAGTLRAATIVGYGATDIDSSTDDFRKRYAVVPVLAASCTAADARRSGCVEGTELVGGQPNYPDTCKGDSGGPLLAIRTVSGAEEISLAGVTSRAVKGSRHSCGEGGIYERMDARARNWIASARAAMGA